MVLGGERDEFIPATDVMLTGVYYGVTPSIVRGCAHAIMLERSWETAADLVCEWLIRRFGPRREARDNGEHGLAPTCRALPQRAVVASTGTTSTATSICASRRRAARPSPG